MSKLTRLKNSNGDTPEIIYPFERDVIEFDTRSKTDSPERRRDETAKHEAVSENLSAWEHVQLARHPARPRMLDYTARIFDDVMELHGDRAFGDDPAMITGIARFQGQTVMIVGQQKGVSTEEKVERNFGMAHPDGYRKAMRIYKMAERFGFPVLSFIDTPAAHPGIEAEERGQGTAIAQSIMQSLSLRTPILCSVIGEGGSGGALAIAVGDHIVMFEHAFYVICPPERCAEILWRDVEKKELAASALKLTAKNLHDLGVIDKILLEPGGGAHRNPDGAAQVLSEEIDQFLSRAKKGIFTLERRQKKFQRMGMWNEPQILNANEAVD